LIIISFTSVSTITQDTLSITIDNQAVSYVVEDSTITINPDIQFGFHKLVIKPNFSVDTTFHLQFTRALIDSADLRQCLYMSYCIKNNKMENTTVLSEYHPNWVLPFGNPVSWWISECAKYIPNGYYGKNLSDTYEIFYPDSILINEHYPSIIKDFFKHTIGFHAYPKELNKAPLNQLSVPFAKINLEYDEEALYAEFVANQEILENGNYTPAQVKHYQTESQRLPEWRVAMAVPPETIDKQLTIDERLRLNEDKFPLFNKLIKSIKGIEVALSFVGTNRPGAYVYPHIDDHYQHVPGFDKCTGCCQIFIPIGWKEGNYFKYGTVGLVPFEKGALITNTNQFVHCSVNQSDTVRFTIGIVCKFVGNEFNSYLEDNK
jgi:hypothetical protein